MEKAIAVGDRVKYYRKKRSMTIQQVAEAAGLSKGLISQIENRLVSPPIATLFKIANVLEVPMARFFQDESSVSDKIVAVKESERKKVNRRKLSGSMSLGYSYESLAWKKTKKSMEPFIITFEPKQADEVAYFSHQGEEFHFVIEGELEFISDKKTIVLGKGDSLYFESNISHGFRALNGKPAKTLVVIHSDY